MTKSKTGVEVKSGVATFISKVIAFVKGGDEARVAAVVKESRKKWNKQIQLKESKIKEIKRKLTEFIEDKNDYLTEAKDAYKEAFLNIDVEVKGKDNVRNYIDTQYEVQIASAKAALESIEEDIKSEEKSSAEAIEALEKGIATYKEYLVELS